MCLYARQHIVYRLSSIVLIGLVLAGCAGATPSALPSGQLSAVEAVGGSGAAGFARALAPRAFSFPRDHGPHQEYATEWWYYTGNLDADSGRHFGFQLTFFRFALAPTPPERPSDWGAANIYMAHLALTDVAGEQFHAFERFSRSAAGLAGAQAEPFRVWLEGWSAEGSGPQGNDMRLRAAQDDIALDLALATDRPPVLQGDRGLTQKGAEPGNASYYYSLTRMATEGAISVGGRRYAVHGLTWMDHEFGTGALDKHAVGWDWFAVQLDDGRDLMFAMVRTDDGRNATLGTLIESDGAKRESRLGDATLDVLGAWRSPRSGAEYPSGWRLRVPSAGLDLRVTPYLADQELPLAVVYWEGAVKVEGTAGGKATGGSGYAELTGYAEKRGENGVQVR